MQVCQRLAFLILTGLFLLSHAAAQIPAPSESPSLAEEIDEIISLGQTRTSEHDGMKAFYDGDFETAEVEFEREFLSLRRGKSARENAAFDAANGQFRAENFSLGTASSSVNANAGGGTQTQSGISTPSRSPNASTHQRDKDKSGRGLLLDGKITDDDFSFTKYMAGLSEIQLGKYEEAEKSFKSALHYNSKNYDARLRLGLIHLKNGDYDAAAEQLKKLDKLRKHCKKRDCDDAKFITASAITLSSAILNEANEK